MPKCRYCALEVSQKRSHIKVEIRGEDSYFCNEGCRLDWERTTGVLLESTNNWRHRPKKGHFQFAGGRDPGDETDAVAPPHRPPENNK